MGWRRLAGQVKLSVPISRHFPKSLTSCRSCKRKPLLRGTLVMMFLLYFCLLRLVEPFPSSLKRSCQSSRLRLMRSYDYLTCLKDTMWIKVSGTRISSFILCTCLCTNIIKHFKSILNIYPYIFLYSSSAYYIFIIVQELFAKAVQFRFLQVYKRKA